MTVFILPCFEDFLEIEGDSVEVGQIGVFFVDGCGYIKELGKGCLISHNSSYDPIPLQGTENRCIGRVLGTADVIEA